MIASILAQQPTGPEFGKSSPIGLVILVALLVGTALLIWSMNKKIKRLPATFEQTDPALDQALDEGTDRAGIGTDTVDPVQLSKKGPSKKLSDDT